MKNKSTRDKGITLVALVVTIIVLLILAGITISIVLGQNGLIQRARDASATWENAVNDESIMMSDIDQEIGELANAPKGVIDPDKDYYWGTGADKKAAGIYIHSTGELVMPWNQMQLIGSKSGSGSIYSVGNGLVCSIVNYPGEGLYLTSLWVPRDDDEYLDDGDTMGDYYDFVIPEGVIGIMATAFMGRDKMLNLYIPSTCTKVSVDSIFYGLPNNLNTIYFAGSSDTNLEWKDVLVNDYVEIIYND